MRQGVGGEEQHTVAGKEFAAGLVARKNLATLRQPLLSRQSLGPRIHGGVTPPLDGEALAAPAAAAGKHRAPIFRAHALEEPMRALAAAIVRLVRTLH